MLKYINPSKELMLRNNSVHIQGVLLPDRQTLRGDSRHEDKHY